MKIIVKKDTKHVAFYFGDGDKVQVLKDRIIGKRTALEFGSSDYELIEGVDHVDFFIPNCMGYNNGWFIHDQELYDQAHDSKLNKYRDIKKAEIYARQIKVSYAGLSYNEKEIDSDMETVFTIMRAIDNLNLSKESAIKINLRSISLEVNAAELLAIKNAINDRHQTCQERGYDLATEVDAALTKDDIDSIDFYCGWPTCRLTPPRWTPPGE